MTETLLIRAGHVLTMDAADTIHSPGWVWLEGEQIAALGPGEPSPELAERAGKRIDGPGLAALPALVNAHTHFSQTFMRGLGNDLPLLDWLKQVMWPLQAAMTPHEMHLASLLGLVENLRCGAGAVVQHHKLTASPAHVDAAAEAAETVGLRLRLARGWADLGEGGEAPQTIIAETRRLVETWHGRNEGRISVAFGPMVPWRCSDETMRRTAALAAEWGIPVHIHVAEAQDEIELLRRRTGLRHIEWLHHLGVLNSGSQLVHCVWLSEEELDLIAEAGSTVIHCPVSNMYLASGIAPLPALLGRGIPVALGTDGPASHNSQDILETLKTAALLAKVGSGDATALLPLPALRMVTTAGVGVLGQRYRGQLIPGATADLTLVDLNTARSAPVHRPESALVYNAAGPDVHTVIVAGQVLLDAGRVTVLDEAALLEDCRLAAARLLERAGVERRRI